MEKNAGIRLDCVVIAVYLVFILEIFNNGTVAGVLMNCVQVVVQ